MGNRKASEEGTSSKLLAQYHCKEQCNGHGHKYSQNNPDQVVDNCRMKDFIAFKKIYVIR